MDYQQTVSQRLKLPLAHHPYLGIEFEQDSFRTTMVNRSPNMLGHYAGGDVAYLATASAAMQCVSEGIIAQLTGMSVECIAKGDADLLLAKTEIVHQGSKLIRTRCEIFGRKDGRDSLIAIAQVNMAPLSNQKDMISKVIGAENAS